MQPRVFCEFMSNVATLTFAPSTQLKMILTRKRKYSQSILSVAFVVIMLLNKRLTRIHSQKDPRLHFAESFTLTLACFPMLQTFTFI